MARRQFSDRNQGRTTVRAPRTRFARQGLTAASLAVVAFFCYYATLLPGLDLGDSASFQTAAGSLTLSPRHAYPLYYALGSVFTWLHPGEPARAMNVASAVYGALAVGLATYLAARLAESIVAGLGAGMFLAFSYTFWTQAITAEVYTLHLLVAGASIVALLAWADGPTPGRLGLFYAIYALGFGNHLSMVLLLPAFAVFLLVCRSKGSGDPLRPRLITMAVVIAGVGTLQYAWNFRGLWAELEPPATIAAALDKFWFDVTKADWRETLVMNVSEQGLRRRPGMYWFDLRQQFGVPGIGLAVAGLLYLTLRWPVRALLLTLLFAVNLGFAWTYNVGDAYIFFLPSHYVVALAAGAGVAAITWMAPANHAAAAVAALLLAYPAWRGYDTFPAVDRSWDRRAERLLGAFVDDDAAIYGVDTNWQVQNAFEYFMRERRPGVPWFITDELEWLQDGNGAARFGQFVSDNVAAGREVVVTDRVLDNVHGAGTHRDTASHLMQFSSAVRSAPPGTPYALAILLPDREYHLDAIGLTHAWSWLAPGARLPGLRPYTLVVGRVGEPPVLIESRDRPYRVRTTVPPFDIDVRMESWLPTDTIRRAGFGHVVVGRRHALTLERGLNFVALPAGEPVYGSGLFAPVPRLVLSR
jgi:hypothetical protein